MLLSANVGAPTFARAGEGPDFHAYLADGALWAPVEIVDVHRPGYHAHAFYKADALPAAPLFYEHQERPVLEDPWQPLRNQIYSKSKKAYPNGTVLLAYYNIGGFRLPDLNKPFGQQLLAEHVKTPFTGLNAFARVLS